MNNKKYFKDQVKEINRCRQNLKKAQSAIIWLEAHTHIPISLTTATSDYLRQTVNNSNSLTILPEGYTRDVLGNVTQRNVKL